ncbi:MBL fold metallo-hydrolase [Streptomyces sp. NPDC002920]
MAGPVSWAESGPCPVADGVFRLPLPIPDPALRATNVYVVEDADGIALIDGGWADPVCRRALVDGLAAVGHSLADISAIHVTHSHLDHYSLAIQLRHELGLTVTLGRGEEESLLVAAEDRDDLVQTTQLQRYGQGEEREEFERGLRQPGLPFHLAWEPPDRWLDGGDKLDLGTLRLDVVDMPGHTRGSLVFRDDAAGVLFSGDSVLPHITPSVGFESLPEELPLGSYLHSLQLLLAQPDATLLPAHGEVLASTHGRVEELLRHHDERLERTLSAVRAGARTGREVASTLRWTRRELHLDDLDVVHRGLAVIEIGSHLDVLVDRGALSAVDEDGGVRHYSQS